jgi:hypothetical protein
MTVPRTKAQTQPPSSPTQAPRTTPARGTQLDLFGAPQQRRLQAENAWLRERLAHAKEAYRALRDERDALTQAGAALDERYTDLLRDHARLTRDLESSQWWETFWRDFAQTVKLAQRLTPAPATAPAPTLKKLLALCHPDKWSRGQPATELAHELSVAINRLRQEGQL